MLFSFFIIVHNFFHYFFFILFLLSFFVYATARQISFADWELMRQRDQGIRLEPLLEAISSFLDDQRDASSVSGGILVRGLKQPDSGRHGLTATQVLRSLVLMRLKNWDYRELRERIADGLTLRQFTDFYCAPVPKHDAFQRGFVRLTPQTLKAVNDLGGSGGGRARTGGRREAAGRHHGGADRRSSSDRQHVVVGCGPRCHTLRYRQSGQSAGTPTKSRGFATAHVRRGGGCMRSSA